MWPETPEFQKALEAVRRMAYAYAERGPYVLNPDETVVTHVLRGLAQNKVKHGLTYCPCRVVTGEPPRDAQNICPCPGHRQDIEANSSCECGLFVSKAYAETVKRHSG